MQYLKAQDSALEESELQNSTASEADHHYSQEIRIPYV